MAETLPASALQVPGTQQAGQQPAKCSDVSELHQKAKNTRAGFKRPSWWVLAFGWSLAMCAGIVNAVAFRVFGFFVSHATGATTSIALGIEGYHHNKHEIDVLLQAVALLTSFLLGAFACGLLIDKNQVYFGGKALYGVALLGNAALLVAATAVHLSGYSTLLAGCCASTACGLQNAMCTSHFGAVVRTTHVTGTITDIGSTMGRMAMIFLRKGCRRSRLNVLERAEVGVDARKLLVLGPMWLSFLFGTIAGAYLEEHLDIYAMLVPASLTFLVGVAYTFFRQGLKDKLKRMEKARLRSDLGDMHVTMERAQSYIRDWRSRVERRGKETRPRSCSSVVFDVEQELGQMVEAMHEVESNLEALCSDHAGEGEPLEDFADEEAPASALRSTRGRALTN